MKIKKAVITAAGMGTRILPFSSSVSKEMLPVIQKTERGVFVKPYVQFIFENLYKNGIKEFCVVLGRNKNELLNYFTPDWKLVEYLERLGKNNFADEPKSFFEMIESSKIVWISNPNSKGFGHSVLVSKYFMGNNPFVVCASDVWATSKDFLQRAETVFFKTKSSATLILKKVKNWWDYDVAKVDGSKVTLVVEKPKEYISDLGIVPIYLFTPEIFDMLREVERELKEGEEFHLTFAIQKLVEKGKVSCTILRDDEDWLDTGIPEKYKEVIDILYGGI